MNYRVLLILALIISKSTFCQEKMAESSFGVSDDVEIKNAPRFYSNYFSEFKINTNLNLRIEMQQSNTINYILYEFPLLFKHNFNYRFSLLFGPKIDLLKNNQGKMEDVSLFSTLGAEYNLTNNFSLEGRFNQRLTKEKRLKKNFSGGLGGKYKFGAKLKF